MSITVRSVHFSELNATAEAVTTNVRSVHSNDHGGDSHV